MNINMRIDTFNIDFSKFTKAMERDCDKLLKLGAQKWLLAVLSRIPIRTGFLAGAFTPLEDLVGVAARDTKTGKTTGKIMPSRNPLLSKEKQLNMLRKREQKLLKDLDEDMDAYEMLKGELEDKRARRRDRSELGEEDIKKRDSDIERTDRAAKIRRKGTYEEQLREENERIRRFKLEARKRERELAEDLDKMKAIFRIRRKIERLEKQLARKNASQVQHRFLTASGEEIKGKGGRRPDKLPAGAEYHAGMSGNEVRKRLEQARQQLVKAMGRKREPYNPKLAKEFITGKIKVKGKTKYLKVRRGQTNEEFYGSHPISRYIRERENVKRQVEAEKKIEKKIMTMAERIRAKQAEKGMVTKLVQETTERVKTGRYILKRKESAIGKDILAFREYYKYTGGKVLKTPRSGIQFTFPTNPNEIFGKFSGAEKTQFEQQIKVVQTAKSQIESFLRFRAEFERTANAESTIKGIINKGSTNIEFPGPKGTTRIHTTSPKLSTGPVPNISSGDIGIEMQRTYNEIMTKTRTDKQYFTFRFGVNIRYWDINDKRLGWHSRQLGNIAFLRFMKSAVNSKTMFPALTNLNSFLIKRSATVRGKSVPPDIKAVFRGTNV